MELNLADLFECVADTVPDRVALVAGPVRLTFRELDTRATRLAHGLASQLGVGPGDRIALYLRNRAEFVEAMVASYKLRAVPFNVNYRYGAEEVAYLLADAGAVGVITDAPIDHPHGWVVSIGAGYEDVLAAGGATRDFAPRSADDHYLLYTGGTTGRPKGVLWRHADIFYATLGGGNPGGPPIRRPEEIASTVLTNRAQRLAPFLPPDDPGPDRFVTLALGPLMHASGQWSALGSLLAGGTSVIFTRPSMDMHHVLDLIEVERVCMLTLVGDTSGRPLADALEAHPGRWDTASLQLIGSGGSILSGEVKSRLLAALPSVLGVTEAVGSSEAPVQGIAVARPGAQTSLIFSTRPDTMVVDEALRPVVPGSGVVGRLATRGHVPLGYLNDPEKTAATFVEIAGQRWAMPGDMAVVEADGTVRLLGRGSLCINTGGEKVYPEEVEAVVTAHPSVVDAVIVGLPDERLGERVTAVVQLAPAGALTLAELQASCRPHLAGYKLPRQLVVVEAVPRSPTGKADYRWAREVASADQSVRNPSSSAGGSGLASRNP